MLAKPPTPSRTALELERQARLIRRLRQRLAESEAVPAASVDRMEVEALPPFRDGPYAPPPPAPDRAVAGGAWPRDGELVRSLAVAPGDFCRSLAGAALPVIAVSVCGLSTARLEQELEEIEREQSRARNFLPLVITDDAGHLPAVRSRGWTVELLPREEALEACPGAVSVASLLETRLRLLAAQWRVTQFVDRGRRPLPLPDLAAGRQPALPLVYFKDYGRYNPYQRLLYASLPGIASEPGSIETALALCQQLPHGHGIVFHLHWEEAIYTGTVTEADAEQAVAAFLGQLDAFLTAGGVLAWTVHNLEPHENRFPDLHARLSQALIRRAGLIHVHNRFAGEALLARGTEERRILLLPHGNYDGLWAEPVTPEAARSALGLAGAGTVFGLVGSIRPYKGATELLAAFAALPHESCRLLLAGRQFPPLDLDTLPATLRAAITVVDRLLEDEDFREAVVACDFLVLPYRRITTSGSVMLAFSLGVPVIVPDLPAFEGLVEDGTNGILYPPDTPSGLRDALLRALRMPAAARLAMGEAGRRTAARHDRGWIGRRLAAALQELARSRTVATPGG